MDTNSFYPTLPADLSGSRSKNRFRLEILWGFGKMLDLISAKEKFAIIFDNVCDIEIVTFSTPEMLYFYQIKTHSNGRNYNCKLLTKRPNNQSSNSILGKLYLLNKDGSDDIELGLVTNVPYCVNKKLIKENKIAFSTFEDANDIIKKLQVELSLKNINLNRMFYIFTYFNFDDPENAIKGKLITVFFDVMEEEADKPVALYRLIYNQIVEKACCEKITSSLDEVIKAKGIKSEDLLKMFSYHCKASKTGFDRLKNYIENLQISGVQKRYYNHALSELFSDLEESYILQSQEKQLSSILLNLAEDDQRNEDELMCLLNESCNRNFPEIGKYERELFLRLIVYKFEEGAYDGDDF